MKPILTLICVLTVFCSATAQPPVLDFGKGGKFKIAQFTDTHLDLGTSYSQEQADKTIAQLRYILDTERPDLVVFTGDVVTGKPAADAWRRVLDPVDERRIPFCVMLGNHDLEQDLSRGQIARIVTAYPGSLNTLDANGELADVVLEIGGPGRPSALLYCIDSHDYSPLRGVEGYGWFSQDQIRWYRDRSAAYTAANGGQQLPALGFFHIPLQEYVEAWRNPENTRVGRAAEEECPGALNPGMFAAMVECGDVMGIFTGHDHDNDYVVANRGVALGYGRYSGDDTVYNNLRPGVRLVQMTEGKRSFETWIRERDGRMVDHVEFRDGKINKIKKNN